MDKMNHTMLGILAALIATYISGCTTMAKTTGNIAAMPFKATYHTGRLAGKGVVGTGKFVGKSAINTGKGVYYVGRVPVRITDKALDTSVKVLTVTTKVVGLGGKVMTVSRQIQAAELEAELAGLRGATDVLSVTIDAFI